MVRTKFSDFQTCVISIQFIWDTFDGACPGQQVVNKMADVLAVPTVKVVIVGAGVIGLSCALCLKEKHPELSLTVVSDRFTPDTTSDCSGALACPEPGPPSGNKDTEKRRKWFREGVKNFHRLHRSEDGEKTGVSLVFGYYMYSRKVTDPWFKNDVIGLREVPEEERAAMSLPNLPMCWFFGTYSIDCTRYLPWLMEQLKKKDVPMVTKHVRHLFELFDKYDIVVNCSGLGARDLVPDPEMVPLWGQGLTVKAPHIKYFIKSDLEDRGEEYIYLNIFPRVSDVFLGGIKANGKTDSQPDPAVREVVLNQLTPIVPSLRLAPVLKEWVALRPHRPNIRLERETVVPGKCIIHNYGHSGFGVNFSWGCALDVMGLVEECLNPEKSTNFRSKL